MKIEKNSSIVLILGLALGCLENLEIQKGLRYFNGFVSELAEFIKSNPEDSEAQAYRAQKIEYFFNKLFISADKCFENEQYEEAIIAYRQCMNYFDESKYNNKEFWKKLGDCFRGFKVYDIAIECYEHCVEINKMEDEHYRILGDICYFDKGDCLKAIKYYEKYVELNQTNAFVYNMLGHIYEAHYKSEYMDKQIDYFQKAHELIPTDIQFVRNLALVLGKAGQVDEMIKYYEKVIELGNNNDDLYDFACASMKNKRFDIVHKYLKYRFYKETNPTQYADVEHKRWHGTEDLSEKTLLVHYEQGFGDSMMHIRYLPFVQKIAKRLIFKVQSSLLELFRGSYPGYEIIPDTQEFENVSYDFQVPLLDLYSIFNSQPDTIPSKDGYLKVSEEKINDYAKEHIKTSKFKIGLAFRGTPNFQGDTRDIPIQALEKLAEIEGVQIYSLQVENGVIEMKKNPALNSFIDLSPTFDNFEKTAMAVKNMDLIVTSDNSILNLAGALGARTFGLFNFFSDDRWFALKEGHSGWYNSVKPYVAKKYNGWDELTTRVCDDIKALVESENKIKI